MKAVYDDGREGVILAVPSDIHQAVGEVLGRHPDCVKIWIVEDDAPSDAAAYAFAVPDWELVRIWLTRADGDVAKVWVGMYSDESVWEAFQRVFPITYPMVIDDAVESSPYTVYHNWNRCYFPGEDSELAQWYEEGEA